MNLNFETRNGFDSTTLRPLYTSINDLESRAPGKYDAEESELRCKLACAYRLVDMFGWTNGIYGHLTARTADHHILLNPFGILFHEVTASSLIKVSIDGTVVDTGSTNFGFNPRAYTLHSAIHDARPDVIAVVHLHVPEVMAMSGVDYEYIPVFQENQFAGPVSLHGFSGILLDLSERESIIANLGTNNMMLLKNHGFVSCGVSVEEAFFRAWTFIGGMKAISHMLPIPQERWTKPNKESVLRSFEALKEGEKVDDVQYEPGELNWQAWMRVLDGLGLNTGYKYRTNLWK